MIIEKIKKPDLKARIEGYIKNFPRKLSHNNPTKRPELAAAIAEMTRGDDIVCLPSDKTIEINRQIEHHDLIMPSKVVEHFIRTSSHRVVMKFCICRESMNCRDYPINLGCIFLGDAAKEIDPEIGDHVSIDEALQYAEKCRQAGLVHSVGKSKLDSIWLAVGPDEKLMTICNCCPCCCLTRTVPYSAPEVRTKFSRMPGVTVSVNNNCIGCGACVEKCIFHAISVEDDRALISGECRGCTRCISACPKDAIFVTIEDSNYVDNTIKRITERVKHN